MVRKFTLEMDQETLKILSDIFEIILKIGVIFSKQR